MEAIFGFIFQVKLEERRELEQLRAQQERRRREKELTEKIEIAKKNLREGGRYGGGCRRREGGQEIRGAGEALQQSSLTPSGE